MLSTKDLVFKERPVHKLVERYVEPYEIEEVVSSNTVKLRLPSSMRIHLVVNVSRVVQYREQVKRQKKKKGKPVEVEGVKEQEVEKILNKRKIRGVDKYLVRWKGFTAESDTQEKEKDLKNAKKLVDNFERRVGAEIKRQEREVEKKREKEEYRRMELLGKYTAKLLYRQDDKKFKKEYLKKLEKNQRKWKNNRQINENKHLKNIEEKMEEENEKIRNKNWRPGHFSGREILKGE